MQLNESTKDRPASFAEQVSRTDDPLAILNRYRIFYRLNIGNVNISHLSNELKANTQNLLLVPNGRVFIRK